MSIPPILKTTAFWVALAALVSAIVSGYKINVPPQVLTAAFALLALVFTGVTTVKELDRRADEAWFNQDSDNTEKNN